MATHLEFEGVIAGAKLTIAKNAYEKGGLELVIKVEAPKMPSPPNVPYDYSHGFGRDAQWKPRPEDVKRKKAQTDEEYEALPDVKKRRSDQVKWEQARARYDHDMAGYQQKLAATRERMMTYALLPGVAALFGNEPVNVLVTPANQDILPGLALQLLPEGAGAPPPAPEYVLIEPDDDDGEDE